MTPAQIDRIVNAVNELKRAAHAVAPHPSPIQEITVRPELFEGMMRYLDELVAREKIRTPFAATNHFKIYDVTIRKGEV